MVEKLKKPLTKDDTIQYCTYQKNPLNVLPEYQNMFLVRLYGACNHVFPDCLNMFLGDVNNLLMCSAGA